MKLQDFSRNLRDFVNNGERFPSIAALARASGLPTSTVSRIIRGELSPSAHTIARIEQACQVSLWPHHEIKRFGTRPHRNKSSSRESGPLETTVSCGFRSMFIPLI
ncbi:helix-turn-helix domain-containing protein [Corynebacterium sp. S7]